MQKLSDLIKYIFSKHTGDELLLMFMVFLLILGAYKTEHVEIAKNLSAAFTGGVLMYIKGKSE